MKIVFLGGSTIYGEGDETHTGWVGHFKKWHDEQNLKNRTFNLGIGGDTTQGMIQRIDSELSARKPDLIILYPGLNDSMRKGSADSPSVSSYEEYRTKISELIAKAKKFGKVILMSAIPPDEQRSAPFRGNIFFLRSDARKLATICRESCEEEKINYFPLFEKWENEPDLNYILRDGVHANQHGHVRLFTEFRDYFLSME